MGDRSLTGGERADLIARLAERLADGCEVRVAAERALVMGGAGPFGERSAVVAGCVEAWLAAAVHGVQWTEPAPSIVALHARCAARDGVSAKRLLGGYLTLRDLLWRTVLQEAGHVSTHDLTGLLQQLWAGSESVLSSVLLTALEVHREELRRIARTPEQRRAWLVRRLVAGDRSVDLNEIRYDFNGTHLGVVAMGEGARRVVGVLARGTRADVLELPEHNGRRMAWLRMDDGLSPAAVERLVPAEEYPGVVLCFGRDAAGLEGFCETHRMAEEALSVAMRRDLWRAWYADIELDAALLRDPDLARSLIASYVAPLEPQMLALLQAHVAGGWNESATARSLNLSRSSVRAKLKSAGVAMGRPVSEARAHIELAIRAVELSAD